MTRCNLPSPRLWDLTATLALMLALASVGPAVAQDAGDADAGRKIAETWCINCHVVAPGQTRGSSNGAPPFTAIAAQSAMTPMALSAFLQTPHHRMPDLQLSRTQIDDVSAYIFSLRGAPKK
jgi:mono/diheme cytochrome c family protein